MKPDFCKVRAGKFWRALRARGEVSNRDLCEDNTPVIYQEGRVSRTVKPITFLMLLRRSVSAKCAVPPLSLGICNEPSTRPSVAKIFIK